MSQTTRLNLTEFAKRVRSTLFRQDKDHESYTKWDERVKYLRSPEGGKFNKNQAVIQASKDFKCLYRIFREYDLKEFDPNPGSHPEIYWASDLEDLTPKDKITCEHKDYTYKQSLQWAIDAAGKFARTGEKPSTCPCDTAYYLYQQAVSEPKDFLGRVGQIESKAVGEDAETKDMKRSGKRTIKEIESMLVELLHNDE